MYNSHPYSPTGLDGFIQSPAKKLYEKYIAGKASPILRPSDAMMGTEVHKFVGDAFTYLKDNRTFSHDVPPSTQLVNDLIRKSIEHSKSALTLKTSQHMKQGAVDIIKEWGTKYLNNNNMDVFIEKDITSQIKSAQGGVYDIAGRPDIVFIDKEKKIADIVDLKNIRDRRRMGIFDNADKKMQTKMYSYMVQQDFIKNMYSQGLEQVNFHYVVNSPWGKPEDIPTHYDKQQLANLETEIRIEVAKAESYNQMSYEKMRHAKDSLSGYRDIYKEVILRGGCNPGIVCRSCTLRYSCHKRFVGDVGKAMRLREGIDGNVSLHSLVNDLNSKDADMLKLFLEADQYDKINSEKIFSKQFDKDALFQRKEFKKRRIETLKESGLSDDVINKTVSDELKLLRQSQSILKKQKRGQFEDSLLDSAIAAREKLPYNVLNPIHSAAPQAWLHENLSGAIKQLSYDTVNEMLQKFDIYRPEMTKRIINNLFTNKQFVDKLDNTLVNNAAKSMVEKRLIPTVENLRSEMGRISQMLDKTAATHIMEGLQKSTIEDIRKYEADKLRGKISPRTLFEKTNNEAIFSDLKSSGVIEDNPSGFMKRVKNMDSAFSRTSNFKLSAPKYFMSTMMKAAVLTGLASNETMARMVQNKIDKAAAFFNSEEQGIDTGTHNSTYTVMRRLLLSDFGSKRRLFNPISSFISKYAAKGSSALKSSAEKIDEMVRMELVHDYDARYLSNRNSALKYGAIGGAIALSMSTIVPRMPSPEERKRIDYKKKEELKKRKTVNATGDSMYQNPQSRLRDAYKIHTQFGSPMSFIKGIREILQRIPLEGVIDYLKGLTVNPIVKASSYYGRSVRNVYRKGLALDSAVATSENITSDSIQFTRRSGKAAAQQISSAEHTIDQVKNTAVRNYRTDLQYKHGMKNLSGFEDELVKAASDIADDIPAAARKTQSADRFPLLERNRHKVKKTQLIANSITSSKEYLSTHVPYRKVNLDRINPSFRQLHKKIMPYATKENGYKAIHAIDIPTLFTAGSHIRKTPAAMKIEQGRGAIPVHPDSVPRYENYAQNSKNTVVQTGHGSGSLHNMNVDLAYITKASMHPAKAQSYGKMYGDREGWVDGAFNKK